MARYYHAYLFMCSFINSVVLEASVFLSDHKLVRNKFQKDQIMNTQKKISGVGVMFSVAAWFHRPMYLMNAFHECRITSPTQSNIFKRALIKKLVLRKTQLYRKQRCVAGTKKSINIKQTNLRNISNSAGMAVLEYHCLYIFNGFGSCSNQRCSRTKHN